MNCADCGESVKESERAGVHWCCRCRAPMHQECTMLLGGESACEACFTLEGTRFTLVMAAGTGEGRDPISEEGETGYTKPLAGEALRLVDSKLDVSGEALPWELTVAELAVAKDVDWFGGDGEDE